MALLYKDLSYLYIHFQKYIFYSNNKLSKDQEKTKNELINLSKNHQFCISVVPASAKKDSTKAKHDKNQVKVSSKPIKDTKKPYTIPQKNKTPEKNIKINTTAHEDKTTEIIPA